MAGLHFDITGDNSNFLRKLEESRNGVRNTSKQIEDSGLSIEQMFNRLTTAAAAFGVGLGAKQLVSDITRVRGEFQQLEVAFNTMLGSKEKADILMSQLVATAAKTPFDLQGVAGGAKQLLAYGVAAEEINGTLIRLGDIAAGLSIPLGDLIYLYGTTRAQGRLYTEDFNQFTGRGIPMVAELAKQFGVAENKVKKLVEEGKVGFPEVQKVIESLTNEGGKFGGLMEAQSKTITGQISNIEDSITNLYNKLGQSNEGVINLALGGVSNLLENYEKVGEAIAVAVTAYGSYKAVLMATTAMQTMNNKVLRQAVIEKNIAAASGISLSKAEAIAAARTRMLTLAQNGLVKSLKATAAATIANPYVLMAAAVTSLAYGIYKLSTYESDAEKAQKSLNEAMAEAEKSAMSEHRQLAQLRGELSALTKGTDEYNKVKKKIVDGFGKYYNGLDEEITKVGLTEVAYNKLSEAIQKTYSARQYEKFAKEEQSKLDGTVSDNLLTIQKKLYERLGDEKGAKVFTQLRSKLLSGELGIGRTANSITGLGDELEKTLDYVADREYKPFDISYPVVEQSLTKIILAQRAAKKVDDMARVRFGISELEEDDGGKKIPKDAKEEQNKQYWEEKKKAAESALYNLDISKKGSEDWKKYVREIEEAQKQIDKYSVEKGAKSAKDTLKVQEKSNEQLISLQRKNQQDEVALMDEGREKKLAKINADFEAQRQAIKKQAKELADANKEAKTKGLNKDGLTVEQQAEIDKANELNVKSREKAENDVYRGEMEAMRNYLKEYGTLQQQKLAITEEYAEKIRKAQTQGEKMSLQREQEEAIKSLDGEFVSKKFNWESIFGDLSLYSADKLKGLREELRLFLETDKKLSESDKIKLIEQYNRLGDAIINDENALAGLFSFKSEQESQIELLEQEYELRQKIYDNLRKEQASVNSRHQNDKINLENFLKQNGIDLSASYEDIVSIFSKKGNTEGLNEFNRLFSLFGKSGKELDEVTEKVGEAGESMQGASEALQGAGKSAGATIAVIDKIIHKVNDNVQSANELLQVLELDDTKFGQGFSAFAKSSEYATQAWESLKSGNVMGVVTGVVGSIKELGNAFGTWFGPNGTAYYEKVREELENINEIYDSIIDKSREDIQFGGGVQSIEAATLALDNYNKKVENLHKLAAASGRAGASWKDHSAEWHSNKNVGAVGGFQQMSQLLDKSITSMTDLYSLSGDELYLIMTQMPEAWGLIDERIRENLNSIIECKDEGEELKESLREAMTGVTYDSFFGGFIDNLADMSTSFEDMCDNFEDSLRKSIIAGLVSKQYKDKIRELYEDWSKYAESDGIDKDESNDLKKRYQKLVQGMIAERDEMSKTFGWESEKKQEASRGFDTEMTHEDAGELSGRFTALQVAGEEIKVAMINMLAVAQVLSTTAKDNNEVLSDIRNLMFSSNGYLEDIASYSKKMLTEFNEKLNSINENINKAL